MHNDDIYSFPPHGGIVTLREEDIIPLRGDGSSHELLPSPDFTVVCDETNNSPESIKQGQQETQEIKASVELSFDHVADALYYSIYTREDLRLQDSVKAVLSRITKRYNKRKAQRRARTGRR